MRSGPLLGRSTPGAAAQDVSPSAPDEDVMSALTAQDVRSVRSAQDVIRGTTVKGTKTSHRGP